MRFKFSLSSALALILLASVGLLGQYSLLLFIVAAACTLGLYLLNPGRSSALIFLIVGFAGATCEILAIHFGAWTYTHPDFLGIPAWLPLVWGSAGLYIARLKTKLG